MGRVIEPLKKMGAVIHGRDHDTLAPITVIGKDLKGDQLHDARCERAGEIRYSSGWPLRAGYDNRYRKRADQGPYREDV